VTVELGCAEQLRDVSRFVKMDPYVELTYAKRTRRTLVAKVRGVWGFFGPRFGSLDGRRQSFCGRVGWKIPNTW
jgi:hypothetical protein